MKHTVNIIGLVTYTGPDTIVFQNSKNFLSKQTQLEGAINNVLKYLIIVTFTLPILFTIMNYVMHDNDINSRNTLLSKNLSALNL